MKRTIIIVIAIVLVSCGLFFPTPKKREVKEKKAVIEDLSKVHAEEFIQAMQRRKWKNKQLQAEQQRINEQKKRERIAQVHKIKRQAKPIKSKIPEIELKAVTVEPVKYIIRYVDKDGKVVLKQVYK